MAASILISLGSLMVAGAMLVIAAVTVRRSDMRHLDQKADWAANRIEALQGRIDQLEGKLRDCEQGRQELKAENLRLFQRLDKVERDVQNGAKRRRRK